jgi:UPF0755 protein
MGYVALRYYEAPSDLEAETNFIVNKGEGLNQISQKLHKENIAEYPIIVKFFSYAYDLQAKIKAGEYQFPPHISPQQAIGMMVDGNTVRHKVTIIEGKTVFDAVSLIKSHEALSGEVTALPQEGTLMPETYIFERNMPRDALIKLMQDNQLAFIKEQWALREENLPIASPQEALTLASIVEKETGIASERDVVASVFINRLRKGMRLQSDPTIIYGITKGKGPLGRSIFRSDILSDQGGYNTYVIDALPPTPICNPSKEAIKAVLHPAKTNYIFFVADGTGGHAFSQTLKGHNNNVQKWRKIEKEMKNQ